jgi:hypothetical protein
MGNLRNYLVIYLLFAYYPDSKPYEPSSLYINIEPHQDLIHTNSNHGITSTESSSQSHHSG